MNLNEYLMSVIPYEDIRSLNDYVMLYYPKHHTAASEKDGNSLAIDWMLANNTIDEVRIICLGNRLYGNLVPTLWENYPDIKINLLLSCSESISDTHQRTAVEKKIKKVLEHNLRTETNVETELHITTHLPTLRACVLYNHSKPIFCCYQRYQNSSYGVKGKQQTPCFIVRESALDNFALESLVHSCEKEFVDLLGEHSVSVGLDERGEIYYE